MLWPMGKSKHNVQSTITLGATDYLAHLALVCTAAEAGELLGVTQERVNQFCLEGRLAAKRPGRDWIISRKSAEALAAVPRPDGAHRAKASSTKPKRVRRHKT